MAEILIMRLLLLAGAIVASYYLYKYITAPEREDKEEVRQLKRVIEASKSWGGKVTPADIAFSMDMSLHDADKLLTKLVAEGLATAEVNEQGVLDYDIPRAREGTNYIKLAAQERKLGE